MALFAVRGFFRGAIEQLMLLLGLVIGIAVTAWMSQWVGAHWLGARPAVVFVALRWLVSLLAGVAIVTLCVALGEKLRSGVHEGPAGVVDKLAGSIVGVAVGALAVLFVTIALLSVPLAAPVARPVLAARVTAPLLERAVDASTWLERRLPAVAPLGRRFESAEARARRFRTASS